MRNTITDDFFRARLDQMIDLKHPLAALAQRLPWGQIEAALSPAFPRRNQEGRAIEDDDLFGPPQNSTARPEPHHSS